MPPLKVLAGISSYRLVQKKTRMVWLAERDKSLIMCLAVSTEYRRVTDRQTDILRQHIAMHSIARWNPCDGRTDVDNQHTSGCLGGPKKSRGLKFLESRRLTVIRELSTSTANERVIVLSLNPLDSIGNYSATSNNIKLVHWPLMGGPLHLVQRGGDWAGFRPAKSPPCCTKCNGNPSTASVPITVLLYDGPLLCGFNVAIKGLTGTDVSRIFTLTCH